MVDFTPNNETQTESINLLSDENSHIAEIQLNKIFELEEKLHLIEEEKLNLENEIACAEKKYNQIRDARIAQYLNADFSLAQMELLLPVKRSRLSRNQNNHLSTLQTPYSIYKYLLESSTNIIYRKLHELTKEAQIRFNQSNDDLLAWKFSPESSIGKRLMSRMRQLLDANEELGKVDQADRVAVLESDADIQATCMKEFIKMNEGIETVLEEAYTDIEGLQSNLLILHQQINQTESIVEELQNQLESRQPGKVADLMAAMLMKLSENETDTSLEQIDNFNKQSTELDESKQEKTQQQQPSVETEAD